jgi:DDE family transposase
VNRLRGAVNYLKRVYDLGRLVGVIRDHRLFPQIPGRSLHWTLLLGAFLRVGSLLDLSKKTRGKGWQRLVHYKPVSDDALAYVLERSVLEDWRCALVAVNRRLKLNKQFESAKIGGLLVVCLDANEQFNSRSRCCAQCCQRQIKVRDRAGQESEQTEYYHRQVYAQIIGPDFSAMLDLEPIRPGEDEAASALRLLGRMRRLYGVRFFDAITVDAWYTKGPFLGAVEKLGWGWVSVLKQERYEIYQEASALLRTQIPLQWQHVDRAIKLWEIKDLDFTDPDLGKVRVVVADEAWSQTCVRGGRRVRVPMEAHWRWVASQKLDICTARQVWQIGHQRWGIENHAFNELTQHYDLEHCVRHDPVAIVAWLLIRVLGFLLFEIYTKVHGKAVRLGGQTLKDICNQLWQDLGRWEELEPLWSG